MPWGMIGAAAISTLGSLIGGKKQQDASQDMAREQMQFQERMSSTAHQREVADLRSAGLNPILSAKHGGASTPAGAAGTAVDYIGNAARAGVSTAFQAKRLAADLEHIEQDISESKAREKTQYEQGNNLAADTAAKFESIASMKSQQELNAATQAVQAQEWYNRRVMEDNLRKEGALLDEELHSARAQAEASRQAEKILQSPAGRIARTIGVLGREALPFANSAATVRDMGRPTYKGPPNMPPSNKKFGFDLFRSGK